MSPTYYQIELSARMLTVLLVALALLLVLAFAFGYGAAWSVLKAGYQSQGPGQTSPGEQPLPTPTTKAATVVAAARRQGVTEGRLLAQTNSRDIMQREMNTSSRDSVGYAAVVY